MSLNLADVASVSYYARLFKDAVKSYITGPPVSLMLKSSIVDTFSKGGATYLFMGFPCTGYIAYVSIHRPMIREVMSSDPVCIQTLY
jgi:hypothetical protein